MPWWRGPALSPRQLEIYPSGSNWNIFLHKRSIWLAEAEVAPQPESHRSSGLASPGLGTGTSTCHRPSTKTLIKPAPLESTGHSANGIRAPLINRHLRGTTPTRARGSGYFQPSASTAVICCALFRLTRTRYRSSALQLNSTPTRNEGAACSCSNSPLLVSNLLAHVTKRASDEISCVLRQ